MHTTRMSLKNIMLSGRRAGEPDTKLHTVWSIYVSLEKAKLQRQKEDIRAGNRERRLTTKGHKRTFGGDGNSLSHGIGYTSASAGKNSLNYKL